MKYTAKISLIIALAICISIGGVYAAWTYTNYNFTTAGVTDNGADPSVTLAGVTTNTVDSTKGVIQVSGGYSSVSIDDAGAYKAELVWGTAAPYSITFDPTDVVSNGQGATATPQTIDVKCVIAISGSNTYDDKAVLSLVANNGFAVEGNTLVKSFTGVGTTAQTFDLAQCIELGDFTLASYADYDAFNTAISGLQITVTFSDANPTA